jgi:hypothetical protein
MKVQYDSYDRTHNIVFIGDDIEIIYNRKKKNEHINNALELHKYLFDMYNVSKITVHCKPDHMLCFYDTILGKRMKDTFKYNDTWFDLNIDRHLEYIQ